MAATPILVLSSRGVHSGPWDLLLSPWGEQFAFEVVARVGPNLQGQTRGLSRQRRRRSHFWLYSATLCCRASAWHSVKVLSERCLPQPQRIRNHRNRTKAHRRRRNHRTQQKPKERIQHARRDRHANRVVYKRPEKILFDIAHCRAA